jgi:hypothetical protein
MTGKIADEKKGHQYFARDVALESRGKMSNKQYVLLLKFPKYVQKLYRRPD